MGIYSDVIRASFLYHLDSLKNFHFYAFNPVFWLFLLILFLILLRFWEVKKTFSFCMIAAIILLSTTKLENFIADIFAKSGELFDPRIIGLLPIVIIPFIFLYYAFIRKE